MANIAAILSAIATLVSAIIALIKFIKAENLQQFINDLGTAIINLKTAKTPEDKTNAAKSMVDIIHRL